MAQKVFSIKFRCSNCNNEWEREFEKGVDVKSHYVVDYNYYTLERSSSKKGFIDSEIMICPVCDSVNISSWERKPIKD